MKHLNTILSRLQSDKNVIIPHFYLNLDKNSQTYKSFAGQKDIYIDTHSKMHNYTDSELRRVCQAYKYLKLKQVEAADEYVYLDCLLIKDLLDYQLSIRDISQYDEAIVDDIVLSFRANKKLASQYDDLNDKALLRLLEKLENLATKVLKI